MKNLFVIATAFMASLGSGAVGAKHDEAHLKGYDITPTGLSPVYPASYECSPLTSLYASWIDVDGSRRDERHSGVDGGRLNDLILAPGPGTVRAVWKADWGWGREGALLIVHARGTRPRRRAGVLLFRIRPFDVSRGERLQDWAENRPRGAPGARIETGRERALPGRSPWEVWEVEDDSALKWRPTIAEQSSGPIPRRA